MNTGYFYYMYSVSRPGCSVSPQRVRMSSVSNSRRLLDFFHARLSAARAVNAIATRVSHERKNHGSAANNCSKSQCKRYEISFVVADFGQGPVSQISDRPIRSFRCARGVIDTALRTRYQEQKIERKINGKRKF